MARRSSALTFPWGWKGLSFLDTSLSSFLVHQKGNRDLKESGSDPANVTYTGQSIRPPSTNIYLLSQLMDAFERRRTILDR